MFTINNLRLNGLESIALAKTALLVGVKPYYKYNDGKPSDIIEGYKYICVAPSNKYSSFDVKIAQEEPSITNEDIEAAGGKFEVSFKDFNAFFYFDNRFKNYVLTAKASDIIIIAK